MKIYDLMSHSVSCVRPETSIVQVAKQMRQEDVGAIPVCDDQDRVLGIVTDRDIVIRSVSNGSENLSAMDIMSRNPITVSPGMSTHEAALLMAGNQVRRLPVVENERLVGFLSLSDIARRNLYVDEAGDALSAISKATPIG
ncbi:MAG: CBS domain-containing protein [Firmicutes bacterium]|nr:CBS domain-containing protein [Bacillota bacterium]